MVAVLHPLGPGRQIVLDRAVVLVGRSPDCDAVLNVSTKISRVHCALVQVDQAHYIRDLGSTNGIWVNGNRVEKECLLTNGNRVAIGDLQYQFYENVQPPPRQPAGQPRRVPLADASRQFPVLIDQSVSAAAGADEIVDVVEVIDEVDEVELIDEVEVIDQRSASPSDPVSPGQPTIPQQHASPQSATASRPPRRSTEDDVILISAIDDDIEVVDVIEAVEVMDDVELIDVEVLDDVVDAEIVDVVDEVQVIEEVQIPDEPPFQHRPRRPRR